MSVRRVGMAVAIVVAASLSMMSRAPAADIRCSVPGAGSQHRDRPYLGWLNEIDLARAVCEEGRETYRSIVYEFHLSRSARSFRLDVGRDGHATITLRGTETVIEEKAPHLESDRSRVLTAEELAVFRQKFAASGFWTPSPSERKPGCVENGVTITEVVIGGRYGERQFSFCTATPDSPGLNAWFDEINRLARSVPAKSPGQ